MKKLLLLVMLACFCAGMASASNWTRLTVDGEGNWNDPNNWSDGVPTSADGSTTTGGNLDNYAMVVVTDEQTYGERLRHGNYSYDANSPDAEPDVMTIRIRDGGVLSSIPLSDVEGEPSSQRSYIGDVSRARMIVMSGGEFNHDHRLIIGNEADVDGTLSVNGGTVNVTGSSSRTYVGQSGTGILNVTDGGVHNTEKIYIGVFPGGIGTVNVYDGGTVNADSTTKVGTLDGGDPAGDGFINVYPGGVFNCQGYTDGRFIIDVDGISTVNLVGDGRLATNGNDLADANDLIALGGFAAWGIVGGSVSASYDSDADETYITADYDPMDRFPEYDGEIDITVSTDVELSWVNLPPLDPNVSTDVWVDVWYGTDMTWITPADGNIPPYYVDFVKIVDANSSTIDPEISIYGMNETAVAVVADGNNFQEYLWRVDTYYSDPTVSGGDPNVEGIVMPFSISDDFPPTIVIDSPSMITWVGGPAIPLTATVTDEGTSEIIIEWDSGNEVDPNIIFTDETWDPETGIATANVTVDYPTNNFNVRVRATDAVGTYLWANLLLQCRADACDAARWLNGRNGLPQGPEGDVNIDCYVDLVDLSILAGKWLSDYTIDEPTAIP